MDMLTHESRHTSEHHTGLFFLLENSALQTKEQSPHVLGQPGSPTSPIMDPAKLQRVLTRFYFQQPQLWVLRRVQSSLLTPAAGRVCVQLTRGKACGQSQCKG